MSPKNIRVKNIPPETCSAGIAATRIGLMKGLRTHIGAAIKDLRKAAHLTQPQLAEAAGIEQSAISKIERGHQGISAEGIAALCAALGTRISDFWVLVERHADDLATAAPIAAPAPRQRAKTYVDHDIDAIRYALGAIAIAVCRQRPGATEVVLDELHHVPAQYLEKEGLIDALLASIEAAAPMEGAASKPSRARAKA